MHIRAIVVIYISLAYPHPPLLLVFSRHFASLEYRDQFVQPSCVNITSSVPPASRHSPPYGNMRLGMLDQMLINLIHQQDSCRACSRTGSHIIDAISHHDHLTRPRALVDTPLPRNVQYPGRIGLGRLERPCDDGLEALFRDKSRQQVVDWFVKVARADCLLYVVRGQVAHQLREARLRLLERHGLALNGGDLVVGGVVLGALQAVDMVENVGGFVDG